MPDNRVEERQTEGGAVKRVELLDLWRTVAIVLMVVFHFLYDLYMFDLLSYEAVRGFWGNLLSGVSAGSFMMVSGAAAHFSRSNLKRGFRLFLIAAALTVVTTIANYSIKFGILHFLGSCMMLYGAVGERRFFSSHAVPFVCTALFILTRYITKTVQVSVTFLYPLGFYYEGFFSADYYPLLPWIFLFIIGIYIGSVIKRNRERPLFNLHFPGALTFLGRHSLIVYAVHQPVLLGIVYLIRVCN